MDDLQSNALLAMLPATITSRLADGLAVVSAATGDVVMDPDEPLTDLWFPLDSVVSLDQVIADDDTAESSSAGVALVGNEGFVGIESLFGAERAVNRMTVRLGGRLLRMRADAARNEFAHVGALRLLLLRSADALFAQVCAIGACERVHSTETRLIRWLLLFDDRVPDHNLALTQEALAQLLHVRRVSVTAAAGLLQIEGLIAYQRGMIMIKDRAGLEAKACKCAHEIKARYAAAT